MGGKESKPAVVDVTDFVRDEIIKMIAGAASVKKNGKVYVIDKERRIIGFIEQQIVLMHPEKSTGIVKKEYVLYNGTKHLVHIPISDTSTSSHFEKNTESSSHGIDAHVAGPDDPIPVKVDGAIENSHTTTSISKTSEEDNVGPIDLQPDIAEKISEESFVSETELRIRARKNAEITVYHTSKAEFAARVGAAAGGAGGALIGGVAGGAAGGVIGAGVGTAAAGAAVAGGAAASTGMLATIAASMGVGAAAGTAVPVPVVGTVVGAIVGVLVGLVAGGAAAGAVVAAVGAGAGAGIEAIKTECETVTLTAEEIFKENEGTIEFSKTGDYVYLTLKHLYSAPRKNATLRPIERHDTGN